MPTPKEARALARRLLRWYDAHRRRLPWRALPGEGSDPYRVWLSEIMLQQTTVAAVKPYFEDFLKRWPRIEDLARAEIDDVLARWQGLGYYARARNLHRCARLLCERHGGVFPESEAQLRTLPGIGAYSAAAIAAIAFGQRAVVVDGNVERVMARLHGLTIPLPKAKARIRVLADSLTPARRTGDYAQAIMDLGATVCTPRKPACDRCPWSRACAARASGSPEALPRRLKKKARPLRRGVAFWAVRSDGAVLLRRRREAGLLGGMMEIPSTDWRAGAWTHEAARPLAPLPARWRDLDGIVRCGFTHFDLELTVLAARVPNGRAAPKGTFWWPLDRLGEQALPTVMKKVVAHARAAEAAEERSG
ncbi:MAG: A/G-specific adenine glycosylase [Alphaproteobacteria bacterium]